MYLQDHKSDFGLYITDRGNFGIAHALYHVTLKVWGVQNNHSYEIFDPYRYWVFSMPLLCIYDDD